MRMRSVMALLVLLLVQPRAAQAATLVMDPFLDPLPPNPCLTVSQQRVLFTTSACDGASCPPAAVVPVCPGASQVLQTSLPSLPAGRARRTRLQELPPHSGPAPQRMTAEILAAQGAVKFTCGEPECYGTLFIEYQSASGSRPNLAALGMGEFRVHVEGEMSPSVPLGCYVLLEDASFRIATADTSVTTSGDIVIPLTRFATDPGFTFNDLRWISAEFGECTSGGCTNGLPIPNFTAGPLTFDSSPPVSVARSSWGWLKSHYR